MEKLKPFDYGPLFEAVQRQGIFADSKTFVDCIAKHEPEQILANYLSAQTGGGAGFDLRRFVGENFIVAEEMHVTVSRTENLEQHIRALWRTLSREVAPPVARSSLLPLLHPYIMPGGRFREIYYWDSYFTMLGLRVSGDEAMIEHMTNNFAHLIESYGFIPNGNRSYYLSRSQPPCFALMVELIAERIGTLAYGRYLPALQAEYDYWMDKTPTAHAVTMPDGSVLHRYYDQLDVPRAEAFIEDELVAARSTRARSTIMRHLRSAAESGWDFSSRWLADGRQMETIHTTDLAPVDLNCLLYQMELTLAHAYEIAGSATLRAEFAQAADQRKAAILRYCWSEEFELFCDYDLAAGKVTDRLSLAGVVPLFFKLANPAQAEAVMKTVRHRFLRPGGVVTTLRITGQQWDAPNGWAPLHWFVTQGLENYGYSELAAEIARRWIKLNRDVFRRTGKLMEKYDVEDVNREAGGGEYPSQDGFGWTNGVLLKLINLYETKPSDAGPS